MRRQALSEDLAKAFRLNQWLAVALFVSLGLNAWFWVMNATTELLTSPSPWFQDPTLAVAVHYGASLSWILFFVVANFLGQRILNKLPADADRIHLKKLAVVLCLGGMMTCLGCYVMAFGTPIFLMLSWIPLLLAYAFGQKKLALRLLAIWGLVAGATLLIHYPAQTMLFKWQVVLSLIPVITILTYAGSIIAGTIEENASQVDELTSLAATDQLTGLINRRQFNQRLMAELSRARRHHVPLSLALFDIDNFKHINDFYGHPVGDRILKELGAVIISTVRDSDIAARYGGEEFALILPETTQAAAYDLLERIRIQIERHVFCLPDNPMTLTISVGVAQFNAKDHTAYELVELADNALYEAKRNGKNQVVYGIIPTPKLSLLGHRTAHKPTPVFENAFENKDFSALLPEAELRYDEIAANPPTQAQIRF